MPDRNSFNLADCVLKITSLSLLYATDGCLKMMKKRFQAYSIITCKIHSLIMVEAETVNCFQKDSIFVCEAISKRVHLRMNVRQ